MLDRRKFLTSGALCALAFGSRAGAAAKTATESDKLDALLQAFVQEQLDLMPEMATSMGLDIGARAGQRRQISDASPAGRAARKRLTADQRARLSRIDRTALKGGDAINFDSVAYGLAQTDAANRRFAYGQTGAGTPYVVNQLGGAYHDLPDFFDGMQPVKTADDAEAYLIRLGKCGTLFDQESETIRSDAALGVVPPDFSIDRTLAQMKQLRAVAADQSMMAAALARRAKDQGIAGDWAAKATTIVEETVYPALTRQIALFESLRAQAVHDAGVWRLPDGEAYYAAALEAGTTTKLSPAEVHAIGLEVVADCQREADAIMKTQGLDRGSVGARLRHMFEDPKFQYANTEAGKNTLIDHLNGKLAAVKAMLPHYFATLPRADLLVKRVPAAIEAGAPGGYYQSGSLDGTRPGVVFINTRDTAEIPSWTLPTLIFHEGIPGHHMQISIANEAELPVIRKLDGYNAYVEGWALYAEQLAIEMGMYENDPFGHIGQLHDAMLRAVRLVVDTGMHAMKWSREKAVDYYAATLGDPESAAITEIERYAVWPGQACGYMIGKRAMLRLRASMKKRLGKRFDLKRFHDAVLLHGALPLAVLENAVAGRLVGHNI